MSLNRASRPLFNTIWLIVSELSQGIRSNRAKNEVKREYRGLVTRRYRLPFDCSHSAGYQDLCW